MTRREFCVNNGQGALAIALAPALVLRPQQPIGPRDTAWKRLLADLEREIEELMTKAQVPGLSIALVSEGALGWRRGFGIKDIRSKVPVDDNTVFEAASTSKPLFAYVVMKLCERSVLDLDTPLVKYVPERVVADDVRSDLVTARHILSHTSGLPNWRSKQEPLAFAFTPGERWAYSGEGYSYLQAVVSGLTGGQRNQASCGRFEAGLEVSRSEMLRAQVRRNAASSWALGWEINHTSSGDFIRHGGGNPGYSCFVAGSVERQSGYVIMTNSEDSGYLGVIAKLIAGDNLSKVIGGQLRDAPE